MCSNPRCSNNPTCTNYTYVCPSCTNCCVDTTSSKCVIYKGSNLSCVNAHTGDTIEDIIIALNTVMSGTVCKTYDIQCLGGASNASSITTIQALIDNACTESTNLYNTTCLGGSADVSIYTAVSHIITKICASSSSYPTFDTTCMTDGTLTMSLVDTVNLLIDNTCGGPVCTLDWEDLEAPEQLVGTPLCDILEAVVNNLRCVTNNFSNEFTVSPNSNCTKEVELNLPVATQNILDEIESTSLMITQLRDMGLAKMFAGEDCKKGSIEEKLAFTNKFDVSKLQLTPYNFTMTYGNGGSSNVFLGMIFPNGIYHNQTFLRTNTTGIQTWLNSLNLGTFTVTATTISVILDGDLVNYYPKIVWTNTSGSAELFSTITGSQNAITDCEYLKVDIADPDSWTDVTYVNLWTGDLKYRYNKINKTIEIRPGYLNKSINPSYTNSFSEIAFTIPGYNSDGRVTWNTYTQLLSTCVSDTSCEVNGRVRILDATDDFYVDINDCLRDETPCSPGDVVTVHVPPSFYYVL